MDGWVDGGRAQRAEKELTLPRRSAQWVKACGPSRPRSRTAVALRRVGDGPGSPEQVRPFWWRL